MPFTIADLDNNNMNIFFSENEILYILIEEVLNNKNPRYQSLSNLMDISFHLTNENILIKCTFHGVNSLHFIINF